MPSYSKIVFLKIISVNVFKNVAMKSDDRVLVGDFLLGKLFKNAKFCQEDVSDQEFHLLNSHKFASKSLMKLGLESSTL